MSPADYDFIRGFLRERSGFVLAPQKEYLVDTRLLPVARRAGIDSIAGLVQHLRGSASPELAVEVTEAMMNNESLFFRDKLPFDHLADTVLPELMQRRGDSRRLRVWSAAASTGQEPYSIAMLLDDAKWQSWRLEILATDISNDALQRARNGLYSQFDVQRGLPIQMLMRHFTQVGERWQISDGLRGKVRFQQLNLLADFSSLGAFDVIFCRNVLIYFDQATKIDVLGRIRRALRSDGYLILGAAETVVGLGDLFVPVPEKRGLYQASKNEHPRPVLRAVPHGAKVA